ncbi:unnamed protein product [Diamesa serratosioi]
MRNYQLHKMTGFWYVIQYYSSAEDTSMYACMRGVLGITNTKEVSWNFTYTYVNDPEKELLHGNITWNLPNLNDLSHWQHIEDPYEGIYNTYVIDTDYENWSLIMHCAEKKRNPRYLSALLMSRTPLLGNNVKVFLREKLPKYNIDLNYLFELQHSDCNHNITTLKEFYEYQLTNFKSNQNVKIIKLPDL